MWRRQEAACARLGLSELVRGSERRAKHAPRSFPLSERIARLIVDDDPLAT